MSNPTVDAVIAQVAATDTVIDSAVAALNGVQGLIKDAVDKALAGGATADQLAPVNDALQQIKDKTAQLAAAIPQGTPTTPPSAPAVVSSVKSVPPAKK